MRLLNVHTMQLEDFTGRKIPEYCVLSHRWEGEEISYKEYRKGTQQTSPGYRKIVEFCAFVRRRLELCDTLEFSGSKSFFVRPAEWAWIDTCCIDKRSSSELSEAINSMYNWYKRATVCYVHLSDVHFSTGSIERGLCLSDFCSSQRFTRGWTLQELLAPQAIVFCSANWSAIGHQYQTYWLLQNQPYIANFGGSCLLEQVSDVTKIPQAYLTATKSLKRASIAQRMSWAAPRSTTRVEDEAYCLLGIFGINMPLLYGEGSKAFLRLQEEIIKRSTDQSILAWDDPGEWMARAILAKSPSWFSNPDEELEECHVFRQPYSTTNNGLEMRTKLSVSTVGMRPIYRLTLNYSRYSGAPNCIALVKIHEPNVFERHHMTDEEFSRSEWFELEEQLIYLRIGSELVIR